MVRQRSREFQPIPSGTVSVRGDVSWKGRVFFSPSNMVVQSQPAYALVHARAGFVPRSRRWELSVNVRNLGRQRYVTATWEATGDVAISGRPESRGIGVASSRSVGRHRGGKGCRPCDHT